MNIIAILNIKGGVAKTTSAIAIGQVLNRDYGKRVLLIDADQQGNATRLLLPNGQSNVGTADMLTARELLPADELVDHSPYGLDVIGADFRLVEANKACMLDATRPQQFRFKRQLMRSEITESYDCCLIDCPPDISMAAINSLAIADDVLIPVRADKYGLDGLSYVVNVIRELQDCNERLTLRGCFLTVVNRKTNLAQYVDELLQTCGVPAMKTCIRACTKVGESTFQSPLLTYAPHCTAAEDYRALVRELLKGE